MTSFADQQAAEYWQDLPTKVWVVTCTTGPTKKPTFKAEIYVRASTEQRAVASAIHNNVHLHSLRGRPHYSARLATHYDLGCVERTPS